MALKAANFAETVLQAAVSTSATVFLVPEADITKFPALGTGDWFYLTVDDGTNREIVKCVAVTSNSFTVQRGQENTFPQAWAAGTRIYCAITAATLADVIQAAQSSAAPQTLGALKYDSASGTTLYWTGSTWAPVNFSDALVWAETSTELPNPSNFTWPGFYRLDSGNNWSLLTKLNSGVAFRHLPAPVAGSASEPFTTHVYSGGYSSTHTTVTISNLTIPAGKIVFFLANNRDANPPTLTSLTHPALTNITQRATTSFAAPSNSRTERAYIFTADSNGATGDLVITWSATTWAAHIQIRKNDPTKVGDFIAAQFSTPVTSDTTVSISRTGGNPRVDVCFVSLYSSAASPTISASRNNDTYVAGAAQHAYYVFGSTTAAGASIDGATQTFTSSGAITGAVAGIIQFADAQSAVPTDYTIAADDLAKKLICQPGTTNITLPNLALPAGSDANGATGIEHFVMIEVPPSCTLNFYRGSGAQLWVSPTSGDVSGATVTTTSTQRKLLALGVRNGGLWQVVSGAVDA